MKRGYTRIADLPVQLRAQVVSLRRCGHDVLTICDRLRIEKSSERNAYQPDMRGARTQGLWQVH